MERLEPYHPDVPRHDLDHYLAISRYLFSGTNLKNLTAMGDRCNSSYKLALDILYDPNGNRLPCYDPYGDVTASFSLEGSELFGGHGGGPVWEVCLTPETPETANWGRIFRLKLRLEESLKAEFRGWLVKIGGFLRGLACNLGIIEEVKAGLSRYKDTCLPYRRVCLDKYWRSGAADRTRTYYPIITNDVLYLMSYSGVSLRLLARFRSKG